VSPAGDQAGHEPAHGAADVSTFHHDGAGDQVAQLHHQGLEVVLVSSGSIAAGRDKIGADSDRKDIHSGRYWRRGPGATDECL